MASYTSVNPRTALLHCFPESIWSTLGYAWTSESIKMSRRPPPPPPPTSQHLNDRDKTTLCVKSANLVMWPEPYSGELHITCIEIL